MSKKNIFVLGLANLNRVPSSFFEDKLLENHSVHGLLNKDELDTPPFRPVAFLNKAIEELNAFNGSVDGLIGIDDFPSSLIVPILCEKFELNYASLTSVYKCENKYWSRVEQKQSIPEHIPDFCAFDPFSENPGQEIEFEYPFWIKPVKSCNSHLGFKINNAEDFDKAIEIIRKELPELAEPYNELMQQIDIDIPSSIKAIDGTYCIAEKIMSGEHYELEGCMFNNELYVSGFLDSFQHPNSSVFSRYQYPSQLPPEIQQEMKSIAKRFLNHIQYDNAAFNIEFFWNKAESKIYLIEVNTRPALSHSDLFHKVDGASNFHPAISVALNQEPMSLSRQGDFNIAATFFHNEFEDALVEQVPDAKAIAQIEDKIPGTKIFVRVEPGHHLTEYDPWKNSYSYNCATTYLGAESTPALLDKYDSCLKEMNLKFKR